MPITPTYPGVYVEELPSAVRTIVGVATSITAFIGRAPRGPVDEARRVQNFGDYARLYGGLSLDSPMSYAVQHYFQHGGTDAIITRVHNGDVAADTADVALVTGDGPLTLAARSPGEWGDSLRVSVADNPLLDPADTRYILTVQELAAPGSSTIVTTETFINVSSDPDNPRHIETILEQQSQLVRVAEGTTVPADRPTSTIDNPDDPNDATNFEPLAGGDNGSPITDAQIVNAADPNFATERRGLFALETVDMFNMLYIPPLDPDNDVAAATLAEAAVYCQQRRAVLILDPRADWTDVATAAAGVNALRATIGAPSDHAAVYFPRLRRRDPLRENQLVTFPPGGAVAGIIARTDAERGVWKAPAGIEAAFVGVPEFSYRLTDAQNGILNPLGLNCLRSFPVYGNIVWGARTLEGADALASQWKYLPVRRTALYIEESLFRGLHWVVFEPNDETLWGQIRLNVGAFMQNMFRQGAFQGSTPREAYLVKCDTETNPQNLIDQGIVTVLVGFAPLKPAEFVIIQIQQLAGQLET